MKKIKLIISWIFASLRSATREFVESKYLDSKRGVLRLRLPSDRTGQQCRGKLTKWALIFFINLSNFQICFILMLYPVLWMTALLLWLKKSFRVIRSKNLWPCSLLVGLLFMQAHCATESLVIYSLIVFIIINIIQVSDRSGLFLHEGDIELTESQRKMIKTQISGGRQKRATLRSLSRRWMDSSGRPLIPYYIEGSVGEWVLIKIYSI